MSFLTYKEARPWAKAIRDQAVARTMPPWGAVKGVGSFENDPSLTEVEIQMFVAWVEGGAPKGDDDALAPKPPATKKAATKAAPARKSQSVAGEWQVERPMTLAGLRPEGLEDGQSLLVDAWMPSGQVEHLIWLRNYQKKWVRDYIFRVPLKLPAGTTVHVKGPPAAKVQLLY